MKKGNKKALGVFGETTTLSYVGRKLRSKKTVLR